MRTIELPGYRIHVAAGAIEEVGRRAREATGAHRFAIISDTEVSRLYGERVSAQLGDDCAVLTIPPGEQEKTRERWGSLTDSLLQYGYARDSAIVALGGGVVGDLAGFVAATFMRGIPVVQVPTTLLAMIDASVGGKTGVDTPDGKNLVGAFHRPSAVIADPLVLRTLAPAQLRAGLAEAIKHGVIADAEYFRRVMDALPALCEQPGGADSGTMTDLIARSIEIKASVVRQDEREGGIRKTLNFGHTIGHAVELLSGFRLLHGEAIAIGMVLESRLAELMGIAARGTTDAIRDAVGRAGLPAAPPLDQDPERILAATRHDKKARRGMVEYALPARIGEMAGAERGYGIPVEDELVLAAIRKSR